MVKFADDAEKVTSAQPGEYLFKIYEVNEKTSQAGNDYWQVKFESKEGVKVCDNFLFFGRPASKTLSLLTALGLADGEHFPKKELSTDEILGKIVYINTVPDKDKNGELTGYLKCPWSSIGYRPYEGKTKAKPKKEEEVDEVPWL